MTYQPEFKDVAENREDYTPEEWGKILKMWGMEDKEELLDAFMEEGGNNGEPILNPDSVSTESPEFIMWVEINTEE